RLDRLNQYGRSLPMPLRARLDRALTKDVDARYHSARAMREALLGYLQSIGEPVSAVDLGAYLESVLRDGPPVPVGGRIVDGLTGEDTPDRVEASADDQRVREASDSAAMVSLVLDLEEEIPLLEEVSASYLRVELPPLPDLAGPTADLVGTLE